MANNKEQSEGQPAPKKEEVSTGKGPQPVGPNQQTWENPKPGEELKKEIDELNKKQDIESRNEGPEQEKKSEKNTQDNFDPAKHNTEAPSH